MSRAFRESGFAANEAARFTDVDCTSEKSLTVQSERDEADINKIVARIEKGGMITKFNTDPGFFADVSEFDGLQDMIIKVQKAESMFMELPAQVRERFANDPVNLVEFLADTNNRVEAESLGLVNKAPVPAPPAP